MAIQQNFPAIRPSLSLDFANTKALDPRITFTRASEGRYYDGKTVAKAEENLFLRSQEFDNVQWVANRATVAANTVSAPDGSTTGDTLTEDTNTNSHYLIANNGQTTWATGTYTHSVYARLASGTRRLSLNQSFGNVGGYAIFDLSSGTVAATAGSLTAAIVSAGGGWYRCSVTYTTSSTTARFDIALNAGGAAGLESYTGDGTSGIYIWGAQLEQRSSVTAYTPTTTKPITNYIPVLETAAAGVPRFDHNPLTGESLGLLIEEQRTNLLTYSEKFDNAVWVKTNGSLAATNTLVAPDGTVSADYFVSDGTVNQHCLQQLYSFVSGTTYTATIYAKRGAASKCYLRFSAGSAFTSPTFVSFDLVAGTINAQTNATGTITNVGNGWFRLSITATAIASGAQYFQPTILDDSYGSSVPSGSGVYWWGAQLEEGAFPTSYIKTEASQVTRSADAASMTGTNFSSWYRADEGTLYGEVGGLSSTSIRIFGIGPGPSNHLYLTLVQNSVIANGVAQATFAFTPAANTAYKTAMTYKVNDFASSYSGSIATDISGLVPFGMTTATIGWISSTGNFVGSGYIRKIAYYPLRLPNTQLQALTA